MRLVEWWREGMKALIHILAPLLLGIAVYALEVRLGNYLPDALWMYALVWTLWLIWKRNSLAVATTGFACALILEASQAWWMPGTFDMKDILWYAVGMLLAAFAINQSYSQTKTEFS